MLADATRSIASVSTAAAVLFAGGELLLAPVIICVPCSRWRRCSDTCTEIVHTSAPHATMGSNDRSHLEHLLNIIVAVARRVIEQARMPGKNKIKTRGQSGIERWIIFSIG